MFYIEMLFQFDLFSQWEKNHLDSNFNVLQ